MELKYHNQNPVGEMNLPTENQNPFMRNIMEQVNKDNITDITKVLILESHWLDKQDVSGYKWKLVSDNQNEPTQVHFYKEDMTETLSINLSILFDRHLREYKHHLIEEEREKKDLVEREKRERKMELVNEKANEVIESYELFLKQQVKDEILKQDLKPNLTNLRKMVDELTKTKHNHRNGISYGRGSRKMNSISIKKEWYLENYDKLTQIVLSIDPEHKPVKEKYTENDYGTQFMCLDDINRFTNQNRGYYNSVGERLVDKFYEKLLFLLRKMKTNKISYWFPKS